MSDSGEDRVRKAFRAARTVARDTDPGPDPSGDAPSPPDQSQNDVPDLPEVQGALFPCNDMGNAHRLKHYFGEDLLYVPRLGWHVWDRTRWKLDPDGLNVRSLAQKLQEWIMLEADHVRIADWEMAKLAELDHLEARELEIKMKSLGERTEMEKSELAEIRIELDWARAIRDKAKKLKSEHKSFAKSSGNSTRIKAALTEAETLLCQDIENLDSDALTVNTLTGLLRFTVDGNREEGMSRTAEFSVDDHLRIAHADTEAGLQFITKVMPVKYDRDAKCPKFHRFLAQVQPDQEMRAFLQRWFGLSMTALPIQKFLYTYGTGANGKSLLANLMHDLMGDYSAVVRIESLTGVNRKSGSEATPDIMPLIGARAAFTREPEDGARLREGMIKEMTGGEAMMVRQLHSDFIKFIPYFKLLFTANEMLDIRGIDDGIWRRIRLCPFDVQIPEAERDETLGEKLFQEERSGILNWMIDGLIDYLERGLQEPEQVLKATKDYRKDSDPYADFLTYGCVLDSDQGWISAADLRDACEAYMIENQGSAFRPRSISNGLKKRADGKFRHPETSRSYSFQKSGVNGYEGIGLTPETKKLLDAARSLSGGGFTP